MSAIGFPISCFLVGTPKGSSTPRAPASLAQATMATYLWCTIRTWHKFCMGFYITSTEPTGALDKVQGVP